MTKHTTKINLSGGRQLGLFLQAVLGLFERVLQSILIVL